MDMGRMNVSELQANMLKIDYIIYFLPALPATPPILYCRSLLVCLTTDPDSGSGG
jgi:hypothetical protein